MKDSVVIIGSGNLAWHLVQRLLLTDYDVQIYGRNPDNEEDFTYPHPGFSYISDHLLINKRASIYILCVKDDEIQNAVEKLTFKLRSTQILLHTSGSTASTVLSHYTDHYGVLWPVMSLSKNHPVQNPDNIPFIITASDETTEYKLSRLTQKLTDDFRYADDHERQMMHLTAVISNNFTNHLFALTYDYCKDNHINFNIFSPIILETVNRLRNQNPGSLQTGPAIRKDMVTIERHLNMLESHEALHHLYQQFTNSILKRYQS